MSFKLLTIVGARPQFIKAAAVSRVLKKFPNIEETIVHTGQHFDANMSDIFFEELNIPIPKHNLGVGGGPQGQMTGRMLEKLETTMIEEKPDAVLIYGDTNSTLAGALAAAKLHIPIVHIEAGLRSFNKRMPEEINRIVADSVSSLLLCPTNSAIDNLKNEGVNAKYLKVGDVMFDATIYAKEFGAKFANVFANQEIPKSGFTLCTLHRAENTDDEKRFLEIIDYIIEKSKAQKIVWPVHPRIRNRIKEIVGTDNNVILIDPVGYFDMHALLAACTDVMTDSGGLQKEAYFHEKLCVTIRDETEWVETINSGWNRLWTMPEFKSPRTKIPDYGDGNSAQKCVEEIISLIQTI
ncbi:MAG: UDP-N-acetylglucosamine 2-epimerase (non-hydrolyzing) [Caulobacterales bacterium]|nr:UDP-N-acetylglucosamine 2-epimerase (non-hydrolyzing) [Caulobacterales bacterium]MCA0373384.1 UDP-N-acetylglucosamine 2-epimerase (non-hydrolyzing) [Pseudomonadota bacterium]